MSDALCIVIEEQRRHAPKFARPFRVAIRSPLDVVACLRVARLRAFAALLASGLLMAIQAIASSGPGP